MEREQLKDWIKKHEGYRRHIYKCTSGKNTIAIGRNLDDVGISPEEADYLLDNDINQCVNELSRFHWYSNQPQNVQYALINMCFNMGLSRLLKFKRMIAALEKKDYTKAAIEALDSRWAQQVHFRAVDVATMMRGSQ